MKHLTAYRMLINSLLGMHTMCYKDVNQQSTWHAHYVLHEANIISIVNVMSIPIYKANGKHATDSEPNWLKLLRCFYDTFLS